MNRAGTSPSSGTVAPHLSIERYLDRPAPLRAAQPELNRGLRMAIAPKI